jgi:hypothetical protein
VDHQRRRAKLHRHRTVSGRRGAGHHRVRHRSRASGFSVTRKEDKLGIRASSTCDRARRRRPRTRVLGTSARLPRRRSGGERRPDRRRRADAGPEGALATVRYYRERRQFIIWSRGTGAYSFNYLRRWSGSDAPARYDAARRAMRAADSPEAAMTAGSRRARHGVVGGESVRGNGFVRTTRQHHRDARSDRLPGTSNPPVKDDRETNTVGM